MNQLRFTGMFVLASAMSFLISCGGGTGGQQANTDTTGTDTTTTAATTAPVANTEITTPQNMVVITHKVADYEKWKTAYDAHDSVRLSNQLHNYVIGRGVKDPNMVLVALKADDMEKAKTFAKDPGLKKAMQNGGVTGNPMIGFYTVTFQDTAVIASDIRVSTRFTVKDWDTWQKAFDVNRKEGLDNGLSVRAYGHDADDNHKVMVVSAITDTAKANAFWQSDMIKKRMEAAGVNSKPERLVFRIAQRY
ncbi:hypothetical protein F0L74_06080 [Chitinophaga agrisoli]|uniref:Uncharacterized protein n=1 Tax=Chitinophaga agrisoli TaxID=2607653 RepID=A0A5B2W2D1_9BACT|nr:hypothetical protein [Chitinophaga agrisoli]KAA2245525.1 hypothetical protein F0L74_06080 [Chitinophaga agrisoli]